MPSRRRVAIWAYLVPLTLATAFYLPGILFRYWLYDAGLYAAVSLRMARTGEWWTPMQSNATYFNKPPLAFWVHALFVKVLGESDWVLRLPELLSALACIAFITSIAKRLHGPRVGMLSGILLALSSEYIWRISRFRLDFLHTALMLAGLRMCVEGYMGATTRRAMWWIILSGLPIGLAMLVKPMFGLIALLLAGAWMLAASRREPARARRAAWVPLAMLVALATAAPWHISMAMIHGRAFVQRFFIHESIDRATGAEFRPEPWWWYFRYFLNANDGPRPKLFDTMAMWYWPILACVVMALVWWAHGRKLARRTSIRGGLLAQIYTFGLLAALCIFGDKKGWYLIPVIPGFAWIAAMWIASLAPRIAMRWFLRLAGPASVLALAATLIFGWRYELGDAKPLDTRPLQQFIREHPEGDFWSGSLWRYESAPLYIRTGVWPKLIEDPNTNQRWEPPLGAFVIYDKKRQPKPDPMDEVVIDTPLFVMVKRAGEAPLPREGARQ